MDYEVEWNEALKKLTDIEFALNESSIVAITNKQGIIQFVNDKFCKISGYKEEELVGSDHNIVNGGYHGKDFFKEMWRTIGTGNVWQGEIKNKKKDGTYYWVDTTIVPFLNDDGKPYQYVSIRHDITKLKEYESKIEQMAFYDPLTMLPNRNSLGHWLDHQPLENNEICVMFLDMDRFKTINDTYGHHTGDLLLKGVANRIKSCLQPSDLIVRQGGDEFIILLSEPGSEQDVKVVVENILEQLTYPFPIDGQQIFATVSIGVSMNTIQQDDTDRLKLVDLFIRQADTAMYYAKKQGLNTYCFNTTDQNVKMLRYYQLEKEIQHALHRGQFSVVFQPLMNLDNDQIVGVEALMRWYHPTLGAVSPGEFIPLLEELGDIIPVGKWVLEKVCRQMKIWHDQGIFIDRASVNVSPIQFRDDGFVEDVKQILQVTGLEAKYLELEITEGTILPMGKVEQTMHQLKDLGVYLSIDDFGTGYSSLSYLKNLPINTLKIDKSFINDLDIEDEVIVNTIITMGKNLKFNVLAEGIENDKQLSYLKSQDCHEGQGYYWSKPVTAADIQGIYLEQNTVGKKS